MRRLEIPLPILHGLSRAEVLFRLLVNRLLLQFSRHNNKIGHDRQPIREAICDCPSVCYLSITCYLVRNDRLPPFQNQRAVSLQNDSALHRLDAHCMQRRISGGPTKRHFGTNPLSHRFLVPRHFNELDATGMHLVIGTRLQKQPILSARN